MLQSNGAPLDPRPLSLAPLPTNLKSIVGQCRGGEPGPERGSGTLNFRSEVQSTVRTEAKIILEFFQRQLRAIKAMMYSSKPCPIPCCPMEALFLQAPFLFLTFVYLGQIDRRLTKSPHLGCLMYVCPMDYVVLNGTS